MRGDSTITAFLMVGLTASLIAQVEQPPKTLTYEVASIKQHKIGVGGGWSTSGGRQTIIGTTTAVLLTYAFDIHDHEIAGAPSWIHSEFLDVIAQAEEKRSEADFRVMMRSLLEERFALKAHEEMRELPKYRLILANKDRTLGPHLLKSNIDCAELRRRGEKP